MRAVRAHAGQVNGATIGGKNTRVGDGASEAGDAVGMGLSFELVHAAPLKPISRSAHQLIS